MPELLGLLHSGLPSPVESGGGAKTLTRIRACRVGFSRIPADVRGATHTHGATDAAG